MEVLRFVQCMADPYGVGSYRLINSTTGRYDFFNVEVALQRAILPYSWFTVSSANNNNTVQISWPTGVTYTVVIPQGTYQISDLSLIIQNSLIAQGITSANASTISLAYNTTVNRTTLQIGLVSGTTPQLVLSSSNNFGALIGFANGQSYPAAPQSTVYVVNGQTAPVLSPQSVISINTNLVTASWTNTNTQTSVIDAFVATVPFGSTIIEEPKTPAWFRVADGSYESVRLYFTDATGQPISLDAGINVVDLLIRPRVGK